MTDGLSRIRDGIWIIRDRAALSPDAFKVRLCAAAVTAAMRQVDEEIGSAVVNGWLPVTNEATAHIAAAIRAANILPSAIQSPNGSDIRRRSIRLAWLGQASTKEISE